MKVALTLLLTSMSSSPGWIRPESADLRPLFDVRYQVDLSSFELLRTNAEEWTAPQIADGGGLVFVAASTGLLQARSLASGDIVWERRDLGAIGASMIDDRGRLLLGAGRDLVALDTHTGIERWRLPIGGRVGGQIRRVGRVAIVPTRPNSFVAVNLDKGEVVWRVKRPTPEGMTVRGQAPAAIDLPRGRAYLGFSDGSVVAVQLGTGTEDWSASIGRSQDFFPDVDAEAAVTDSGKAVVVASYNAGLLKLRAGTGAVEWKIDALTRITGLLGVSDSSALVASTGDGQILGLRAKDGTVVWRYRLAEGSPTAPVFLGAGRVVVGASTGSLSVLDTTTGRPLQVIRPGSGLSVPPTWRAPDLVFMSNHGRFFALRQDGGS